MKKSKKSVKELVKPLDQNEQTVQPGKKTLAGPSQLGDMQRPRRAAFGDITNEQPALGQSHPKDKKAKPLKGKATVKISAATVKVTSGAAAGLKKKPKPCVSSSAVSVRSALATGTKGCAVAGLPVPEKVKNNACPIPDIRSSQKAVASSQNSDSTVSKKVVTSKNKFAVSQDQVAVSQEVSVTQHIAVNDGDSDSASLKSASDQADASILSEMDCSLEVQNGDQSRMSLEHSILESITANDDEMPNVPTDLGVEDIDRENKEDITLVALYAHDIFTYYKERETKFTVQPYLSSQPALSETMRAVLVDWLVEVQENFELNHETLYLAVKLLDTYCSLVPNIRRDQIQLIGAATLFVACKFDERVPPPVEDFLYVCDDAYNRNEFLAMERTVLKTVNFELGRPISYRFLRRYAKCARSPIQTLTLARYLLELSLMEYCFVSYRESLLAAASLYIARRMRNEGGWTATLQFYTDYTLADLHPTVLELNPLLTSNKRPDLKTVRAKYNHPVFHSVATIPSLSNAKLFPQEETQ